MAAQNIHHRLTRTGHTLIILFQVFRLTLSIPFISVHRLNTGTSAGRFREVVAMKLRPLHQLIARDRCDNAP